MATENLGAALRTPPASRPYARAHTGYGKRTAPGQRPAQANDFALLPERERYVAGYVDRLPDGGAMDVKSLAKALPLYGQMAVGSALRALGVAGHLRRVRCQVIEDGQSRWVTRTFWSRTARDSECRHGTPTRPRFRPPSRSLRRPSCLRSGAPPRAATPPPHPPTSPSHDSAGASPASPCPPPTARRSKSWPARGWTGA
ncbi:hypothetical protein GCM10020227_07080 [Streptomyces flavovirens]